MMRRVRRWPAKGYGLRGVWVCVAILGAVLWIAGMAHAQTRPPQVPPRQPPPAPERVYPGAIDRPLTPPDILRDDRVYPDSGVSVGLGPHAVSLHSPRLKLDDPPTLSLSEGVVISADMLFGNVRIGYARQFYRRALPAGSTFDSERVNFISVDGDQILATVGWRPWYGIYLGAIGGAEYRLIQLKRDDENVATTTETTGIYGAVAELQIALPFSFQVRVLRETADRIVRLDSAIFQLTYIIPF